MIDVPSVAIPERIRGTSALLVVRCSGKMKLYRNFIGWPIFQLEASDPGCHRPQRLLSAATGSRGLAPKTPPGLGDRRPGT